MPVLNDSLSMTIYVTVNRKVYRVHRLVFGKRAGEVVAGTWRSGTWRYNFRGLQRTRPHQELSTPRATRRDLRGRRGGSSQAEFETEGQIMPDLKSPMCEKLSAASEQRSTITDFLDWLGEQGIVLCKIHTHTDDCIENGKRTCGYRTDEYYSVHESPSKMILRFLKIDEKQLEAERQAILDSLR